MASKAKKTPHKTNQKQLPRNAANRCFFVIFSKAPKRDPKSSKKSSPGSPNAPQERPGSGQERPKRRQDSARSGQARPRSAPRAAQEANKRSKKGSSYRFRSWVGPGRPPGAILERFWSLRGIIFKLFSVHVPCLKRSVEPARARGVASGAPAQTAERGRGARPRSLPRMLPGCRCGSVVSRLQCLQLSLRTRFPFHDSQVSISVFIGPKSAPRGAQEAPRAQNRCRGAPRGVK